MNRKTAENSVLATALACLLIVAAVAQGSQGVGGSTRPSAAQDQRDADSREQGLFLPIANWANRAGTVDEWSAPFSFPRLPTPGMTTSRDRLVLVATDQLRVARAQIEGGAPATVSLNLFDDVVFLGIMEETSRTWSGGYSLLGRVDGRYEGTVALIVNGPSLSGTLHTSVGTYEVEAVDGDVHIVRELAPSGLRLRTDDVVPPESSSDDNLNEFSIEDEISPFLYPYDYGPKPIHVIVVYTERARRELGQEMARRNPRLNTADVQARMLDLIEGAIARTNNAFRLAGLQHRLMPVFVDESHWYLSEHESTRSDQTINYNTMLGTIAREAGSILRMLGDLRNLYSADLVHAIVGKDTPDERGYYTCGLARTPGWVGLTTWNCLGDFTFAHEIGHNMGLHHDATQNRLDRRRPVPSYAQGWVHLDGYGGLAASWRTIMTYDTACRDRFGHGCRQIGYFSNPEQRYADTHHWLGTRSANNVRALRLNHSNRYGAGVERARRRKSSGRACAYPWDGMELTRGVWWGWELTYKCPSEERSGSYSRFLTFVVKNPLTLTVALESDVVDTFLYLRSTHARGAILAKNDDYGGSLNSRLGPMMLRPGTYTIEASTWRGGRNGTFDLKWFIRAQ